MDEDTITKSIASFLAEQQWIIVSLNSPFSGRSVWIKPDGGKRGKGALIPDVIATRHGELMVVESSAPYRTSDERKLFRYLERPYLTAICTMFESSAVSSIRLAVGLPVQDLHRVGVVRPYGVRRGRLVLRNCLPGGRTIGNLRE